MEEPGNEFEGCGREGPIRGIFLAEFHPTVGPRIRLKTDNKLLSPEIFQSFSEYVIPKQRMSGRHVTANAYGYKVMGYPIVLDDESYPRNQFIFNICFVCYPWSRTVQYERAVQKLSRYLVFLEQEKKYLSSDKEEYNSELLCALSEAVRQMNKERRATVRVGAYDLRLVVVSPEDDPPPYIKDHEVPVFLKRLDPEASDLTTRQLTPYIDGRLHVKKIAMLSGVHVELARSCIRDLIRLKFVTILPIRQFGNCYTPTEKIANLRKDPILRWRLIKVASADPSHPVTFKELYKLIADFRYGATVTDHMCLTVQSRGLGISLTSMQEMIKFLLLEGIIRRVYKYPIWEQGSSSGQDYTAPEFLREKMNGNFHYDEICCLFNIDSRDLDEMIERDPCVRLIHK